jgi:peptidoglycan/LPS O-acetylase OafA/YrhL
MAENYDVPAQAATARFEVLDSLRGICACMIVLFHFETAGVISRSTFVRNSWSFVDFFFVLSGFVIAASYGERLAGGFLVRKFMALRLGRIYPLHFAVLALFLVFELVYASGILGSSDRAPFQTPNGPLSLFASLFLVQTFVGPDTSVWNSPSWSIAVELWTYLVFGLVFRWARRLLIPIALGISCGCAAYLYQATDRYLNVTHDGALARCAFGFSLGTVAMQVHRAIHPTRRLTFALGTALELLGLAATISLVCTAGLRPISLAIPPLFFLVVLLFAQQAGAISRLLLLRPFLALGTLSYSIYMVHWFLVLRMVNVLTFIEQHSGYRFKLTATAGSHHFVGGGAIFGDVMTIVMLVITVACAFCTYRLIERPAQLWSRRVVRGYGR